MKLSKILKRALSLFIVGLFVFTAFAVIQSGGDQAQASPSGSSSFTFPYQYGTPTVPSDVGAQGAQGPTIPLNQVGNTGSTGATGHIGIAGSSEAVPWVNVTSNLVIQAYNGTLQSHVPAVNVFIKAINLTWGWEVSGYTNVSGQVSLKITEGYYQIIAAGTSTHDPYINEMNFATKNQTISVYLLPVSLSTVNINNGGSYRFIFIVESPFESPHNVLPEINVSLVNSSSSITLGYGYTNASGSVSFTNINPAYSYNVFVDGYNSETATNYYIINDTVGIGTLSSNPETIGEFFTGYTTSTSTVSGTPLPANTPQFNSAWSLTENTTISGGKTVLSQDLVTGKYILNLVNTTFYFNYGFQAHYINVTAHNSTIIVVSDPGDVFSMSLYNSVVYFPGEGTPTFQNFQNGTIPVLNLKSEDSYLLGGVQLGFDSVINNSIFTHIYATRVPANPLIGKDVSITNSTFSNDTFQDIEGGQKVMQFQHTLFTNTSFSSSSNTIDNIYFNFSRFLIDGNRSTITFGNAHPINASFTGDNITLIPNTSKTEDFFSPSMSTLNFTDTVFYSTAIFPTLMIEYEPGGPTFPTLNLYNDYLNENFTNANLLASYSNMSTTGYLAGIYFAFSNFSAIHTTFVGQEVYFVGADLSASGVAHSYIEHDDFQYIRFDVRGSTINQMMGSVNVQGAQEIDTFSNNTFKFYEYNNTMMEKVTPHGYIGVGEYIEDMNADPPVDTTPNYLYVRYNTFYAVPVGNGTFASGTAPADVVLGENDIISNVSGNVFLNDYRYDTGPSKTFISPMTWNIVAFAGTNYIFNNWFLNLNSQIVPIGSNNNESGMQGWGGQTYLGDNHFFYSPAPETTSVDPYYVTSHMAVDGVGTINYEIPVSPGNFTGKRISFTYDGGGTYISNTTVLQNETGNLWATGGGAIPPAYIWSVTPDVSIVSGSPVISYSNGLVGGPQPNFTWKGYSYSESVEPTYIQVGVNSSKAPSIDLQFQGIAGALYDIEMFNNGSLISSYQESATSLGVLNATYKPATMPLDPVFYVEYIGSGVVPPPVVTPLVPIVPHVLFGIPYLNVIVLFGGIALASEEFFRTQTKGNEKRYSYTGVFVGIMIAGIGLMSVL